MAPRLRRQYDPVPTLRSQQWLTSPTSFYPNRIRSRSQIRTSSARTLHAVGRSLRTPATFCRIPFFPSRQGTTAREPSAADCFHSRSTREVSQPKYASETALGKKRCHDLAAISHRALISRAAPLRSFDQIALAAFKGAFAKRRCLMPADGFYQSQKLEPKSELHSR